MKDATKITTTAILVVALIVLVLLNQSSESIESEDVVLRNAIANPGIKPGNVGVFPNIQIIETGEEGTVFVKVRNGRSEPRGYLIDVACHGESGVMTVLAQSQHTGDITPHSYQVRVERFRSILLHEGLNSCTLTLYDAGIGEKLDRAQFYVVVR